MWWKARIKTRRAKIIVGIVSTAYIIEGGVLVCLSVVW